MWKLEYKEGSVETRKGSKTRLKEERLNVLFLVKMDTKLVKYQRSVEWKDS